MFNKAEERGGKNIETIIGPSVKVKGNFNAQGNVVIDGILEGSIKTEGEIYVGEKAKITASIDAKAAKINGEVNGSIKVLGYLEIGATAKINGDIETKEISIAKGASVNGKCSMISGGHSKDAKTEKTS